MKYPMSRSLYLTPCAAMLLALPMAAAQATNDPVAGKQLYMSTPGGISCAAGGCHGSDVSKNLNKVLVGANNPTAIQNAINRGLGGMSIYIGVLSSSQVSDIAAYIGNPNVSTAPVASPSPTALNFADTAVGATRNLTLTLGNSGGGQALSLSAISSNSAEFKVNGGTCTPTSSVAAGSSCTIVMTFAPTTAGARSGSLTIGSNSKSGTVTVAMSGNASSSGPSGGADPKRGYTLYHAVPNSPISCSNSACHGDDPSTNLNNVKAGTKPFKTYSAIKKDEGGMGVLKGKLTFADLKDIAAYIANPAAGKPSVAPLAKADPVRGKVLYNGIEGMDFSCANSACHGPDPSLDLQSVQAAANKPLYLALTIGSNVGGMGIYKGFVSWQDLKDISAYVANPSVAGTALPTAAAQGLALLPDDFDAAALSDAQRERIGLGSYWINGVAAYGHCPATTAAQAWQVYSALAATRPALPSANLDALMMPRGERSLDGQLAVSRWMCSTPDAQAMEAMRAYLSMLAPKR